VANGKGSVFNGRQFIFQEFSSFLAMCFCYI